MYNVVGRPLLPWQRHLAWARRSSRLSACLYVCLLLKASATQIFTLCGTVQESLADARVTRDSSAFMKALWEKSKLSRKPHPRTKHHVDRQTGCEVMAIFVYPRWPSVAILDFYRTAISGIRSADPENPSLEPDMEWIGCTFARYI